MVVTPQRLASEVGAAVLRQGGNAIDAAVAVGYALAVVDPCCGNIGGGGFMTIHLADGRDRFLNFRETAPAAATPATFLDATGEPITAASRVGSRAAGVPGTVMGLDTALGAYGTMSRAVLMAPAIALARDGFVLTRGDTDILDSRAARFAANPVLAGIFLRPNGDRLRPGDRLVQPDLAGTLAAVAVDGPDAFYHGAIPAAVAALSRRDGGMLTAADFAAYSVTQTDPLRCTYRGAVILSAPPPSSGGTALCEILAVLQGWDMAGLGWHSAQGVHRMVEAMRQAFIDRNSLLGDPAFVDNPVERLLSPAYADAVRAAVIDQAGVSPLSLGDLAPREKPETTQYTVADAAGNAVSVTYTINGLFGALAMAPGTGFLLNNEMDDFTVKLGTPNMYEMVQGAANAIAPGKRPLSSMTPTIVLRDGHVILAGGSPGGPTIITTVLQVIMNRLDYGMTLQEAVDAPRIHHQWLPDVIFAEPFALSPDTQAALRAMAYTVVERPPWGAAEMMAVGSWPAGAQAAGAQAERPTADNPARDSTPAAMRPGLFYGANDDRRPAGAAVAP